MVLCPLILYELRAGLEKRYFADRASKTEASELVEGLELAATVLADPVGPERVLRDPNDDFLVALARSADADGIVTRDLDLLDHAVWCRPRSLSRRLAICSASRRRSRRELAPDPLRGDRLHARLSRNSPPRGCNWAIVTRDSLAGEPPWWLRRWP